MEGQMVAPLGHAHAPYEDDPHNSGGRPAIEGEEKRHDDKPAVLKKVKEKVKKIKEKIGKKKHDDGRDRTTSESEEEEEEEEGYKEDDEEPYIEVHGTPIVRPETGKVSLGEYTRPPEEDPAAPYSSSPPRREGEEIGMSPVIKQFESMNVSEQPKSESESSQTGLTASTDQRNKTYTEKLKSIATVPAEYGMHMASTIYNKISGIIPENPMRKGKVETSGKVNQDKGVSVKEYLAEKLKPGEEDKALSEAISEAMQRRKEEIAHKAGEDVMVAGSQAVTSVIGGGEKSDVNQASDTQPKVADEVLVTRNEPSMNKHEHDLE